jgi:archaellum component FlaG (FlaF/FlaG flagellin family)
MAGAILIASAIGILLMVVVGFVLVGSTLAYGDIVAAAQKDTTALSEVRQNTNIDVVYCERTSNAGGYYDVDFIIKNTGNTIIDYTKLDMVVITQGAPRTIYINQTGNGWIGSASVGSWDEYDIYQDDYWGTYEFVNIGQWDPGEYVYGWVGVNPSPTACWAFTPNGATGHLPAT